MNRFRSEIDKMKAAAEIAKKSTGEETTGRGATELF